jgi:hypothetical protein
VLSGFVVKAIRPTGDKMTRALPWASAAEAGNVKLVRGDWNKAFLDEVSMFPVGAHDDQIDAVSGAYHTLTHGYITPSISVLQTYNEMQGDRYREIEDILASADSPEELAEMEALLEAEGMR